MKTRALKLAKNLAFPIEIAGQTIAMFGIRGSGKTNSAGALAEELLEQNHPIAVIDPTDAWWGLRAGRDGSPSGGYPVFIFGGSHADVPLSETDGKVIAEFLVREQVPVILSLRHLRKAAQRRFVTEFCEELYHLKGKDENRTPLTVFIDEAPLFVPQKVMGEVARTVDAVEDLITRGRNAGFGVVLISQRSATLNADVRTQADTIICHRVTAPLDRKAISDWFEENATTSDLKAILHSLATLKNGEAWVWSPAIDIMARVQMRMRRTFDSSATPKAGATVRPPKKLADVDLGKLKDQLAATIEKAKADDPKELRKRIGELERELKAKAERGHVTPPRAPIVQMPVFDKASFDALLSETGGHFAPVRAALRDVEQALSLCVNNVRGSVHAYKSKALEKGKAARPAVFDTPEWQPIPKDVGARRPVRAPARETNGAASSNGVGFSQLERRLMTALAQYPEGRTRQQMLTIAGYAEAGRIGTALAAMRANGYVIDNGDLIKVTPAGYAALGPFEILPTGDALIEYWSKKLDRLSGVLFGVLVEARGEISRAEMLTRAGYAEAGRIGTALAKLRRLQLVKDGTHGLSINEETFS